MNIDYINYSPEYLDELVDIHRISFKEHFNSRLGKFYTKKFIEWFITNNTYKNIFILGIDKNTGELLGYICGSEEGFQKLVNRELFPIILLSLLLRPYLLFDKRLFKIFKPKIRVMLGKKDNIRLKQFENNLNKPLFSLTAFALSPKYRKMGFGFFLLDKLMDKFTTSVSQNNGKVIKATIWSTNTAMLHYYKTKNWQMCRESDNSNLIYFYKTINP